MIANFHTHSTFCDGKNTPEEIIKAAIEKGFTAIGFSGHGYTDFDLRYCMKDTDGYLSGIRRLREKYAGKIRIWLGTEEDAFSPVERSRFEYIIGSSHYFRIRGQYYPIDSDYACFQKCLAAFDYDFVRLAHTYYSTFCQYIKTRKPDIIGHFDLITKFDETDGALIPDRGAYNRIAEQYIAEAAESSCIFEINTGAMARGLRTTPYPAENLLYVLRKKEARILLSSDSHSTDTLDFAFAETKQYLYDIGFRFMHTLTDEGFIKYRIQ